MSAAEAAGRMAEFPMDLADVNAMSAHAFVAAFAEVAESSPWVASDAEEARPYIGRDAMVSAFANAIAEGEPEKQMALLQAHPELAVRAGMTDESALEQRSAGLNTLTDAERARLLAANARYRQRFGFPFIMAVRGAGKGEILAVLDARLKNPPAAEFARALVEVQRIVRLRIEDRVAP